MPRPASIQDGVNLTIHIPLAHKHDLARMSHESGRSISELGRLAVAAFIKRHGKKSQG